MPIRYAPVIDSLAKVDRAKAADYEAYFETIAPRTLDDVFRRWMFAYASVHTTWEMNCKLYEALKPLDWLGNEELLKSRIQASGAGMHNNRTRFIMQFSEFFWRHPTWFNKAPWEGWTEYRDRIMQKSPGIGLAKAAFFVELTCFHKAKLACFDTHMVQLYGFSAKAYGAGKVRERHIRQIEKHWAKSCDKLQLSPVTARWVLWDEKQGKSDSRYWSHVLEG